MISSLTNPVSASGSLPYLSLKETCEEDCNFCAIKEAVASHTNSFASCFFFLAEHPKVSYWQKCLKSKSVPFASAAVAVLLTQKYYFLSRCSDHCVTQPTNCTTLGFLLSLCGWCEATAGKYQIFAFSKSSNNTTILKECLTLSTVNSLICF